MDLLITDPYILAQRIILLWQRLDHLEAQVKTLQDQLAADRIQRVWHVPELKSGVE